MEKKHIKKAAGAEEIASMYSIAAGTLGNWRSRGEGPRFYRVGRKILYRIKDVESFLFQNPVMTKDSHRDSR